MKTGIVPFSLFRQEGRLDARHYLGATDKDLADAKALVVHAEKRITMAKERLKKVETSHAQGALPGVKVIR